MKSGVSIDAARGDLGGGLLRRSNRCTGTVVSLTGNTGLRLLRSLLAKTDIRLHQLVGHRIDIAAGIDFHGNPNMFSSDSFYYISNLCVLYTWRLA